MRITKEFKFSAAHRLPLHKGHCSRPHGHNYVFTVAVEGPLVTEPISSMGMVFDYGELKAIVEEKIVARLDHQDLNKVVPEVWPCKVSPEMVNVTTAEILAFLFLYEIHQALPLGVTVEEVVVKETDGTSASYRGEEIPGLEKIFDLGKMEVEDKIGA